jgi:hypothetical protein
VKLGSILTVALARACPVRQISVQSMEHEFEIAVIHRETELEGFSSSTPPQDPQSPVGPANTHNAHTTLTSSHHIPTFPRRFIRHCHSRGVSPHVRDRDRRRGQVLGLQRRGPAGDREQRKSKQTGGCDRYCDWNVRASELPAKKQGNMLLR